MRCKTILIGCLALLLAACGENTEGSRDGDLDVSSGNLRVGGLLWDRWWDVNGQPEPTETFSLYTSTAGTQTGSTTWRCQECHGWDYRGVAGRFGSGPHFTGVVGVIDRVPTRTRNELFDIIATGTAPASEDSNVTPEHAFESVLSETEIFSLIRLLVDGINDTTLLIDPPTGISNGDSDRGETLFNSDATGSCELCHGGFGKKIPVGETEDQPASVGTLARTQPERVLHRIRWGIPGSSMPSAVGESLDLVDHNDLVAFSQTLPPPNS